MRKKLLFLFAALSWLFTAVIAITNDLTGSIPFWYDPARDMLSAWDNLHKLTLIGPTSGIPGIFYGPYWVWWLSIGELFSKDPKIVDVLILTLPYLICFPLFLFLFSKIFGKFTSILLWLLFFYSSQNYMTFLWNPHLAPLLFLIVGYLLIVPTSTKFSKKTLLSLFIAGIFSGLAVNIHISFGIGFVIGCFTFLLIQKKLKTILISVSLFLRGIIITFAPFFLFEIRHGFHQTQTALNAFLHGGAVVALHGLSRQEIITQYFMKLSTVLQLPFVLSIIIIALAITTIVILAIKKKIAITGLEYRLLLFLGCITGAVLALYLSAKNPIWDYHFIGADVIALLFIGFLVAKIKPLQYVLLVWVLVLTFFHAGNFIHSFSANHFVTSSLYTEEYIVKTVQHDAKNNEYTVYVYSPSIYSYEYSYLFKFLADKNVPYDPGRIERKGTVYLILPPTQKAIITDFINYHSPRNEYKTTATWHIADGTTILKRQQQSSGK